MSNAINERCPECSRETKPHCQSTTCGWQRCTNRACFALLDFKRRRGNRKLGDERFVPVVFPDVAS